MAYNIVSNFGSSGAKPISSNVSANSSRKVGPYEIGKYKGIKKKLDEIHTLPGSFIKIKHSDGRVENIKWKNKDATNAIIKSSLARRTEKQITDSLKKDKGFYVKNKDGKKDFIDLSGNQGKKIIEKITHGIIREYKNEFVDPTVVKGRIRAGHVADRIASGISGVKWQDVKAEKKANPLGNIRPDESLDYAVKMSKMSGFANSGLIKSSRGNVIGGANFVEEGLSSANKPKGETGVVGGVNKHDDTFDIFK